MLRYPLLACVALSVMGTDGAYGQMPTKPPDPPKAGAGVVTVPIPEPAKNVPAAKELPKLSDIKPLPPVPIPDDPPPHEGAMFDLPITIDPA